MKFEFKSVPVPKWARKRLPKDRQGAEAWKARLKGEREPAGIVVTFTAKDGSLGHFYIKGGKMFGGCTSRQDAAEKLVVA